MCVSAHVCTRVNRFGSESEVKLKLSAQGKSKPSFLQSDHSGTC